ncbi:hypothetical protein K8R14_00255 [bacterium]|nr:hypothetical protein [bacterium]
MQETQKPTRVKSDIPAAIIMGIVLFAILMYFASQVDNDTNTDTERETTIVQEETLPTNTDIEDPLVEEEIPPKWFGKTYKIDSVEFDGLSYQKANLWESYDDRSLIIAVPRHSDITLLGYRKDHDYCKIEYNGEAGWCSCGWISGLPADMTDY